MGTALAASVFSSMTTEAGEGAAISFVSQATSERQKKASAAV